MEKTNSDIASILHRTSEISSQQKPPPLEEKVNKAGDEIKELWNSLTERAGKPLSKEQKALLKGATKEHLLNQKSLKALGVDAKRLDRELGQIEGSIKESAGKIQDLLGSRLEGGGTDVTQEKLGKFEKRGFFERIRYRNKASHEKAIEKKALKELQKLEKEGKRRLELMEKRSELEKKINDLSSSAVDSSKVLKENMELLQKIRSREGQIKANLTSWKKGIREKNSEGRETLSKTLSELKQKGAELNKLKRESLDKRRNPEKLNACFDQLEQQIEELEQGYENGKGAFPDRPPLKERLSRLGSGLFISSESASQEGIQERKSQRLSRRERSMKKLGLLIEGKLNSIQNPSELSGVTVKTFVKENKLNPKTYHLVNTLLTQKKKERIEQMRKGTVEELKICKDFKIKVQEKTHLHSALKELGSSEESYRKSLETFIKEFDSLPLPGNLEGGLDKSIYKYLETEFGGEEKMLALYKEEYEKMQEFKGHLQEFLKISEDLSLQMSRVLKEDGSFTKESLSPFLSEEFKTFFDLLSSYVKFYKNSSQGKAILQKLVSQRGPQNRESLETKPQFGAFLILPIQRGPRYEILLGAVGKELEKLTEGNKTEEKPPQKQAVELSQKLAQLGNQQVDLSV